MSELLSLREESSFGAMRKRAARGARRMIPSLLASAGCLLFVLLLLGALHFPRDEDVTFVESIQQISHEVWRSALLPGREYRNWLETLRTATPLLFCGLAVAVAFRASVLNIGAQGQLLVGAIAATAVGAFVDLPSPLLIPLTLGAGALAGALLAAIASTLGLWRKVPVVLSTLLLNFVAMRLLAYALQGPLRSPDGHADKSRQLLAAAWLPHAGFPLALAATAIVAVLIGWTTFGFRLRAVGANAVAARFAGIRVGLVASLTLALSGALAGLAGAVEIAKSEEHQILRSMDRNTFGFTGIAVALLGGLSPTGVVIAALFFGVLNTAFLALQAGLSIPSETTKAVQGLIFIAVLIASRLGKKN